MNQICGYRHQSFGFESFYENWLELNWYGLLDYTLFFEILFYFFIIAFLKEFLSNFVKFRLLYNLLFSCNY